MLIDMVSPTKLSKPSLVSTNSFMNQLKIRCFICKGKQGTHGHEAHREDLDRQEQQILMNRSPQSKSTKSPVNDLKLLSLNRRQSSFYNMRDFTA